MITVQTCESQIEWDENVLSRKGHPLQLWGWGEVKAAHGWRVDRVVVREGDTVIGLGQLLIRPLPWPFTALAYIPRGPISEPGYEAEILTALARHAKYIHKALVLTIEPDMEKLPHLSGWRQSKNTILIPRTLILDLLRSEDELLGDMTKKTRQYIRKSTQDVTVRKVKSRKELARCLEIYRQTAARAQFALHDDQYYYDIFEKLGEHSPVFAAFVDDTPVAFLWLVISRQTAFELYGGMNDEGQHLRANYTLKWHVIQAMKTWGIERYDLNGLLNDGVSTFKQGFASHENMLVGTYDASLSPLYGIWNTALPLAKKAVRAIKNR